jgi:hypothetical protein
MLVYVIVYTSMQFSFFLSKIEFYISINKLVVQYYEKVRAT